MLNALFLYFCTEHMEHKQFPARWSINYFDSDSTADYFSGHLQLSTFDKHTKVQLWKSVYLDLSLLAGLLAVSLQHWQVTFMHTNGHCTRKYCSPELLTKIWLLTWGLYRSYIEIKKSWWRENSRDLLLLTFAICNSDMDEQNSCLSQTQNQQ